MQYLGADGKPVPEIHADQLGDAGLTALQAGELLSIAPVNVHKRTRRADIHPSWVVRGGGLRPRPVFRWEDVIAIDREAA